MQKRNKKEKRQKIDPNQAGPGEKELERFYELLGENITEYDCGTLCAPQNNGTPLCCSPGYALPLLYRSELAYLQKQGDFWQAREPRTKRELRQYRELDPREVYGECQGVSRCRRDLRSLSCRTFPFEPYVEERGEITGLVFVEAVLPRGAENPRLPCPLVERAADVRNEYISRALLFWRELLRNPAEYDTYREASRQLRKREAARGENPRILTPR